MAWLTAHQIGCFRRAFMSGLLLIASCVIGSAQLPPSLPQTANGTAKLPAFDVVSVKLDPPSQNHWTIGSTADGYHAVGATMWMLVREAYGISEDDRISGAPKWFAMDKFSIEAKVAEQDEAVFRVLDYSQRCEMLQSILADRFKLSVHWEMKEMPVYMLTIAKDGPRLREAAPDPNSAGKTRASGVVRRGAPHLIIEGGTIAALARHLSNATGRTVVDKTGLAGRYDYHLDWTPDTIQPAENAVPNAAGISASGPDSDAPSIFTAVEEQLGLRLEPQKAPVQILVIDHAEKPSPN